jgi:dihydroorotase
MSEKDFDLVITGGDVLISEGLSRPYTHRWAQVDIGIKEGQIAEIALGLTQRAKEVYQAKGLKVLPGAIDTQVHFREPGATHKEDLQTGSLSAVLGGVTSFFDMPNTSPPTTTREELERKVAFAQGRCWANFAFFIGACEENIPQLKDLEKLPHCSGIKIFMGSSTGSLLMDSDASLELALRSGTRRVAIHSEDEQLLIQNKQAIFQGPGPFSAGLHHKWRSEKVALSSTKRIIKIARETGRPVHILHMTTAEELEFLKDHKDICTIEVTPQHLTLSAPDCYERLGTLAQMNPPIREQRHQDALWSALNAGLIDVIGSDHAPHTLEEKANPYPKSPSGMPGVQTLLPLMLHHVNSGRTSLERVVEMCALEPSRIYGLKQKGRIQKGWDADLVVVDLNQEWTVHNQDMATRSGWTPFAGMKLKGSPEATIVNGKIITEARKLRPTAKPTGSALNFSWN